MDTLMQDNLPLFIGLFAGVCIIIVGLQIVFAIKNRKKKKELLKSNKSLAEISFDSPVSSAKYRSDNMMHSGYLLYTVNGELAELTGQSLLVPVGEVILEYQYFHKSAGAVAAKAYGKKTARLTIEAGKKYDISFNFMEMELEYKARK